MAWAKPIHIWNLNRELWRIKRLTVIFMRQWWSLVVRCFKLHSQIKTISQSWKKKSLDFSVQTHSTMPHELNKKWPDKRSIPALRNKFLVDKKKKKKTQNYLIEWNWEWKSLKRTIDKVTEPPKPKSDPYFLDKRPMALFKLGHHWFLWSFQVSRTKSEFSKMI
jgi:hypothetical protein